MLAHSSILVTAFVIAVMVLIASGVRDLLGFTMLDRPVFICPIVGWLFGDIQQGLLIGASLEAVFMGIVNIGGASAAECGIASVVGCAFAIMSGGGPEVALPLAPSHRNAGTAGEKHYLDWYYRLVRSGIRQTG